MNFEKSDTGCVYDVLIKLLGYFVLRNDLKNKLYSLYVIPM